MDVKEILAHCDHTLLKQESTWEQIREVCDDGKKYGCASDHCGVTAEAFTNFVLYTLSAMESEKASAAEAI